FTPNCTLPPPGSNYVAGLNVRSTTGILWNCLSIIILCTWNIQHLNVPPIQDSPHGLEKIWRPIWESRVKVKWMIITILVPEFLVGKALGEMLSARQSVKDMQLSMSGSETILHAQPVRVPKVPWGMVHGYMANMGYFVLDWEMGIEEEHEIEGTSRKSNEIEDNKTFPLPSRDIDDQDLEYLALQNLYRLESTSRRSRSEIQTGPDEQWQMDRFWALDARQWNLIFKYNVATPPKLPVSHLERLDKGGTLVKILAVLQVSYLILQLIVRKVHGLPSAQLEIAALAFSASSIITYLLYLKRPQGIETIYTVRADPGPIDYYASSRLKDIVEDGPRYLWQGKRNIPEFDPTLGPAPIPNDSSHWTMGLPGRALYGGNDELLLLAFGALVGGTVFGGLHCLAWNFHFPTETERLVWRICSVMTSCLPLLFLFPVALWMKLNPAALPGYERERASSTAKFLVGALILVLFVGPYILARLFLMVEIFRSLCFLPSEAFFETWSGNFPHLG
ncbi:uncharacterized protein LY89DRAFT_553621, partial [Mollisia scopiformis]